MWKSTAEPGRPQMTTWRMRISCWITKTTTCTQNVQYLLLFHCNNGCTNALQCYIICMMPAFFFHSCRQKNPLLRSDPSSFMLGSFRNSGYIVLGMWMGVKQNPRESLFLSEGDVGTNTPVRLNRTNNKVQLVIEFIIPKFIEGTTCFERNTAHHQEL
jgi:hypothetical protein